MKGFERLRNWVVFRIVVSEVQKKNLEFLVVVLVVVVVVVASFGGVCFVSVSICVFAQMGCFQSCSL